MDFASFKEILGPVAGYETWDYLLYVLIFLGLVAVFMSGNESSTTITMYIAISLVASCFDKLYAFGYIFDPEGTPQAIRVQTHLGTYWTILLRVAIFAFPLVALFPVKSGKLKGVLFLIAIIGMAYAFGRWWTQDGSKFLANYVTEDPQVLIAQGSVLPLMVGELAYRAYRFGRRRIDRL